MRAVIQRVKEASVTIEGKIHSSISNGLLILLGVSEDDTEEDLNYIAEKAVNLRIFEDTEKKMNFSCIDVKGEILVVSQFTLLAETRKGRRPSFVKAAKPDKAIPLYEKFIKKIESYGITVKSGIFGAMMDVKLLNYGPVTIIIDSVEK
ncbi:MAG: D-tyrosyl-tRNA(Tyr) deacylase [Candidatus Schekmanbacteria bacterium]|nr:MAG: D-tyrosyl-tRNA(Tyr) deacylase [Candidatus Schekmanbacteria bacterium]